MRLKGWEAVLQRKRMRRANWLGGIFGFFFALVALAAMFAGEVR